MKIEILKCEEVQNPIPKKVRKKQIQNETVTIIKTIIKIEYGKFELFGD